MFFSLLMLPLTNDTILFLQWVIFDNPDLFFLQILRNPLWALDYPLSTYEYHQRQDMLHFLLLTPIKDVKTVLHLFHCLPDQARLLDLHELDNLIPSYLELPKRGN